MLMHPTMLSPNFPHHILVPNYHLSRSFPDIEYSSNFPLPQSRATEPPSRPRLSQGLLPPLISIIAFLIDSAAYYLSDWTTTVTFIPTRRLPLASAHFALVHALPLALVAISDRRIVRSARLAQERFRQAEQEELSDESTQAEKKAQQAEIRRAEERRDEIADVRAQLLLGAALLAAVPLLHDLSTMMMTEEANGDYGEIIDLFVFAVGQNALFGAFFVAVAYINGGV